LKNFRLLAFLILVVGAGTVAAATILTRPSTSSSFPSVSEAVLSGGETCSYHPDVPPSLRAVADACLLATLAKETPPTPPPTAIPTPVANLEQALLKAGDHLMGGAATAFSRTRSIQYVETTARHIRALFNLSYEPAPDVADEADVWAFVAYGDYMVGCRHCVKTPVVRHALVVVIPMDGVRYYHFFADRDDYDLGALGSPKGVASSSLSEICARRVGPSSYERYCGSYAPTPDLSDIATSISATEEAPILQ
jgi:hypothetical protein